MTGLLRAVLEAVANYRHVRTRIRNLERSVSTAEKWLEDMKLTRTLTSGSEELTVTGTQDQIDAAAARMSRRTRKCVSISVVVGHYHRRGCDQCPAGGIDTVGN